ncbi:tryptophan synthase subunit alpha [Buchnera aphidicola]|uniref:tryptophan synthase subunit alpha n=1 Tax=Buchnera aphidicola TaxID=9 RepID=UPI0031B831BC
MNRYQILFNRLKIKKEACFIPFVTLGDPSLEISFQIINILIDNGADALELGIPFSDPVADGITVQKANLRALSSGITLKKCFTMLLKIRKCYPLLPIGLLTYANIVFNKGINNFYFDCFQAGVDSILIADMPIEESKIFYLSAIKNNIQSIFICPPNANDDLMSKLSKYSSGYTYLLSRPGVTGINQYKKKSLINLITKLKTYNVAPIIQGFGISNIVEIKEAISSNVSGVICGSVIIKIIEENCHTLEIMFNKLKYLINQLKCATK